MLESEVERVDERFQHFYRAHLAQTVRLARMLTGDPDVADDLAQDAFVRLYRYAQSASRPIDNPTALLRTTTVNLSRSWHTSQGRLQLRMARHGADAGHRSVDRLRI
jgi:DNA-directed RNA polymerase specialized sigma24 family protein